MKKIRIFLGAYINTTNAQNLNCLALARHLDKEKFDIYALELYSGNLDNPPVYGVKTFRCFYPHKISKYLGYLWGIYHCDVAYLPKGEIDGWNHFWLKRLGKKSFNTVEGILDPLAIESAGGEKVAVDRYKAFEKLYSITNFMRTYNQQKYSIVSEEKILYLGTDIDTFLNETKQTSQLQNIVLIGNDLIRKGIDDYLTLAHYFPMLTFHIVGTGNGRIDVAQEIQKRNLENIVYHGGLTHSRLVELLQTIDLHLFPSRSEGFPKVTLETAAAGVPSLVYSDYGASEWITHRHDGFVVDTIDRMKETIEELIYSPVLLQTTSRNAIVLAKRFDWKVLIKNWEEMLLGLVQRNNDNIFK